VTKPFVSVCRSSPLRLRCQDGHQLKSYVRFADLMRRLTDAWLESSGKSVSPDMLYRSVESLLRINMVLAVVDMESKTPHDWRISFSRTYGVPTTLVDAAHVQQTRTLSAFPVRTFVEREIIDACQRAVAAARPDVRKIDERIGKVRIVCGRQIVPDPSGTGRWCIILAEVHSLSSVGRDVRFDDVDLSILQLLREGLPAREIGAALKLSPRTIEHRIERMKGRAGVNAIIPLLAATG
jgi:hypothetical protein